MYNLFENLKTEIDKLHKKYELSKSITPDYFEPGMMEYLDKYEGLFDEVTKNITIRFDARGTRYDGRTEYIERVKIGDTIIVVRDTKNQFNPNNFALLTAKGRSVGNMPAELCNAIAPLYDSGQLMIKKATASYVEPISKRHRYAKQAVLFVELKCKLLQS